MYLMNDKCPKNVPEPRMIIGRKINPNSMLISENQVLAVASLLKSAVAAYAYNSIPTPS